MIEEEYGRLDNLFDRLFPIASSITGPGLRKRLDILNEHIPLQVESVPSGTEVFDWTIPEEWRINNAKLTGPSGNGFADFNESNLHVLNYSEPVDKVLTLEELKPHLYSDPDNPDAIPYVTSYYNRNWGFSISHRVRKKMPKGKYHAHIDSEFVNGELNYGHTTLPGDTDEEILLSSYLCHPSLANNELSGPLVLTSLYKSIEKWDRRKYTYRFVLHPETIGSLAYLNCYGGELKEKLVGGLVLTCLGGPKDHLTYKTTRKENALIDKVVRHLNKYEDHNISIRRFTPTSGSDERQYCSPGFNLPVGQMARTVYGEYNEYHSSKDNKEFMGIKPLLKSADKIEKLLRVFEYSGYYENLEPYGEPMLGKRELYPDVNSPNRFDQDNDSDINEKAYLDKIEVLLNYSDGNHSVVEIANKYQWSVKELIPPIKVLREKGLLRKAHKE